MEFIIISREELGQEKFSQGTCQYLQLVHRFQIVAQQQVQLQRIRHRVHRRRRRFLEGFPPL